MNNNYSNFPSKKLNIYCKGGCDIRVSNLHIFHCKKWNITPNNTSYDKIYNGTIKEQIKVFRRMKINLEKRENYNNPSDLSDPLICQ